MQLSKFFLWLFAWGSMQQPGVKSLGQRNGESNEGNGLIGFLETLSLLPTDTANRASAENIQKIRESK